MDKNVLGGSDAAIAGMVPMKDVLKIAVEVAVGLRKSASKNGIRQMMDFVNGVAFAGVQLQKNYRPEEEAQSFAQTFVEEVDEYADVLKGDEYGVYRAEMVAHRLGVTDQTPNEMLVTAGLSFAGTITTVSNEFNLSQKDVMSLVTMVLALAIVAHAGPENSDLALAEIKSDIAASAQMWDQMFPSDAEMFGEEFGEDE